MAEKAASIDALKRAMARAREYDRTCCIVIDTDPMACTEAGSHWWDIVMPEVTSARR